MTAGCFCVALLVVLSAAGLVALLIQGFALLSRLGIEPGIVAAVLVLVGLGFSVYRAKRDGRL